MCTSEVGVWCDLLCAPLHAETCLYPRASEPIHIVELLNVYLDIRQEIWTFIELKCILFCFRW